MCLRLDATLDALFAILSCLMLFIVYMVVLSLCIICVVYYVSSFCVVLVCRMLYYALSLRNSRCPWRGSQPPAAPSPAGDVPAI